MFFEGRQAFKLTEINAKNKLVFNRFFGPVRKKMDEERKKQKEDWMRKLVQNFGDDEGNEVTFNGTVVQALLMMNGKEINDAIRNKDKGTVAEIVKKARTPQAAIREFYLAALNRPPTPRELSNITDYKTMNLNKGVAKDSKGALYQDLFWALLNSGEFYLNH